MNIRFSYIITLILAFLVTKANAQVLFSDNFDSYPIGPLVNYTNKWVVKGAYNDVRIMSEPNRGKVLAWGWNTTPVGIGSFASCLQGFDENKYNDRDAGNDVLKLEFEFYSKDFFGNPAEMFQSTVGFESNDYYFLCEVSAKESAVSCRSTHPTNYKKVYNNNWVKVEVYFEFVDIMDDWTINIYIPALKFWGVQKRPAPLSNNLLIGFGVYRPFQSYSGALIKYDNIILSAVPNRPAFADVNEFVSSKFNLYPNPVGDVLNVTNGENLFVEQVSVYNASGKQLINKSFNKYNNIQLNTSHLSAGVYILHLKTERGMAVKKFIKK